MLTPDYLDTLPDALVLLWQQVEDDILRDIARRIGKLADGDAPTETAAWQLWRYQQTRALHQDAVKLLARYSGKSDAEIRRILQAAGAEALAADDALYQALGFSPSDINSSPALLNLLNAGYRQTAGTWQNLTATTANTVTRQFETALDRAWLQTSSGAFDYKTAIKRAVDGLAADGLKAVTYPSGHTDTLEVAVRRAVLTGVNQTAAKLQLARAEEMGCEFVEVTAHGGARSDGSQGPADHAYWQGKVYHIGGDVWRDGVFYPDFATATGYGTGEGLCGWNCRHNFFPFWPGISKRNYTDAALEALNARDVPYQGKLYTRYEISQMQRALERRVRSAKRKYLAEDAAGLDTGAAAAKLKTARQSLAQFVQATGGRQDSARESVSGFGRSAAGRATWAARKHPARDTVVDGGTLYSVTNSAIASVPRPFFHKLSGKMNAKAQTYAQNLLRSVLGKPDATEATVSFSADGQDVLYDIGSGTEASVGVIRMKKPYFSFHNHPSNMMPSPEDYNVLIRDDYMVGLGVIGNKGALFTCEKGFGYNSDKALQMWRYLKAKYPEFQSDLTQRIAFSKEFAKEAPSYGITIHAENDR